MDRISAANYQIISGGRRTWQNKNLGAGIVGTTEDQLWFAGVQECIIAVYEQLGITPADATLGSVDLQLLQGVRRVAGGNVTSVSAATVALTADNAGIVFVSAASNNVAITLPAANSANGQVLRFRFQFFNSANGATVAPAGSDKWQPGAVGGSYSLAQGELLEIESDGISNWVVLARAEFAHSFGTSATATVPIGITEADVEVWGAGGGSGGCTGATYNCGSSGSGGGYARKLLQGLQPGTSITVTIGAGGAGGVGGGAAPTAGGTSSFGSYVSATGGGSGANGGPGGPGTGVGLGGVGSGGDLNLNGGTGGTYWFSGGSGALVAAAPGVAPGMSALQPTTTNAAGSSPPDPGCAGYPAVTSSGATYNGGGGSGGLIVVRWRR